MLNLRLRYQSESLLTASRLLRDCLGVAASGIVFSALLAASSHGGVVRRRGVLRWIAELRGGGLVGGVCGVVGFRSLWLRLRRL